MARGVSEARGLAAMREQVIRDHADGAVTVTYWSVKRKDSSFSVTDHWVSLYETAEQALEDVAVTEREEDAVLTCTGEPLAALRRVIGHTVREILAMEERS